MCHPLVLSCSVNYLFMRASFNYSPSDEATWCKFHHAKFSNTPFTHKHSLPEAVMLLIKSIYEDLSKSELLKRCLHGKTQNPNESVNSCIWKTLHKTDIVGLPTLQLGATYAGLCYNEGSVAKVNVFQRLGIKPRRYTVEGFQTIVCYRIPRADMETKNQNTKTRIKRRLLRKDKEEQEDSEKEYSVGAF